MSLIAAPQEEHPSRTSYVNLPVNEYIGSKVFAASARCLFRSATPLLVL